MKLHLSSMAILAAVSLASQLVAAGEVPSRCEQQAAAAKRTKGRKLANTGEGQISGRVSYSESMQFFKKTSFKTTPISSSSQIPYVDAEGLSSCQPLRGYGFAITNSTVYNYNKLPANLKAEVMKGLFSPKRGGGLSYFVLPLSSTDFESEPVEDYSVCNCKNPVPGQNCFDPTRLKGQIQFLKEVQKVNPDVKVLLKPWTQPPFMREPGTVNKAHPYWAGTLDEKWTDTIAQCLSSAVDWVEDQGIKVQAVTPQNEPGFTKDDYPTLLVSAEKMAKILNSLHVLLTKKHPDVLLDIRDDNYNSIWDVKTELKNLNFQTKNLIFAGHCYTADPKSVRQLLPPGKTMFCPSDQPNQIEYMMSECTGHDGIGTGDFPWWIKKMVLNESKIGATGLIAWNGVLDENWGPHNENCTHCRGFVTANFSGKEPTISWSPEFFALAHIASFAQPGAKRLIASEQNAAGVDQLLAKNPDGSTVGLFWNPDSSEKTFRVVTSSCQEATVKISGRSAVTLKWR